MIDLFYPSIEAVAIAAITCIVLREVFIIAMPDSIAGPGGRLIDTAPRLV